MVGSPCPGVLPDQVIGNRGPLDPGPRDAVSVAEEPEIARHRSPTPGHRGLRDPRLGPVHRVFVDHQVERHDPRDQLDEPRPQLLRRIRHRLRQGHLQCAVHRGHAERGVLHRLDQHTTLLRPLRQPFLEEVARQSVHLAEVAVLVDRLGVDVGRRQVIAPVRHQAVQIALVARHPVQRIDVRCGGHQRRPAPDRPAPAARPTAARPASPRPRGRTA